MAFIAEQLYSERNYVEQYYANDYPYRITELLVEKIYPALAKMRDIIYQCIDACLYWSFNPGPIFYHLIIELKKNHFHNCWNLDMITDILETLIKEPIPFETCAAETIRLVKHDFQISVMNNTVKWLENIYKRAGVLRQHPMFMKCFVRDGYNDIHFSQIVIDILGVPPLHNDTDEASLKMPMNMFTYQEAFDLHPEYFNAIACLLSVFNNKKPCSMKQFCQASKSVNSNIEVNGTCDTPWLKLNEAVNGNKQLCPFAFLWKHWGLTGKTPF